MRAYQKWLPILRKELQKETEKAPKKTRSPTHQVDHTERVWKTTKILGEKLGADLEVLVAAVFLHDLARHYGHEFHGPKSAEMAKPVLKRIGFPKTKTQAVLDAIATHDYQTPPSARKSTEAKILYDADKIDAFGKIGIERHKKFYLARGFTPTQILGMLQKRWNGLELKESRKIAKKDFEQVREYFKKLKTKEGI